MKYEAVTRGELVRRLAGQCSPDPRRNGYVIGPDINGRLCHVATCFSMSEARLKAKLYNGGKR